MFRITRNIFALTCDPKCDRKKERERYTRWEEKKKEIQKYPGKRGFNFFLSLSVREGVGTRCFFYIQMYTRPKV